MNRLFSARFTYVIFSIVPRFRRSDVQKRLYTCFFADRPLQGGKNCSEKQPVWRKIRCPIGQLSTLGHDRGRPVLENGSVDDQAVQSPWSSTLRSSHLLRNAIGQHRHPTSDSQSHVFSTTSWWMSLVVIVVESPSFINSFATN